MAGFVNWNPAGLFASVDAKIAAKMTQAGEAGVAEARRLVPVDTGQTKASIGFAWRQSDKTLQIYADTYWSVFLELGTSRMPARPFLRPGLAAAARVWGGNLEMALPNAPSKYAAGYQKQTGSHVTVKRGVLGIGRRKAAVKIGMGRFH
jgi:HK97 gp10 family phage protein